MALFMSARMGIYQEVLYKKHGKFSHEALYITVRNLGVFNQTIVLIINYVYISITAFVAPARIFTTVQQYFSAHSH